MKLVTITQEIFFAGAKAATLFDMYTNQVKHIEVTGSPANITNQLGEPFNLYDGFCFGENIELKQNKLIIQSWRTANWPGDEEDSIVIIQLMEENEGTFLYLTHAGIPENMAAPLSDGWYAFYWNKWNTYLTFNNQSVNN